MLSAVHPTELDALYACLAAAAVTALLTPLTMRLARAVGAIDHPRERGLSERATPLLGGLAIFAGTLVAGLIWLPDERMWHGVLIAATVIRWWGARRSFELPPAVKLAGQVGALIVVHFGVVVELITLPFVGALHFPTRALDHGDRAGGTDERGRLSDGVGRRRASARSSASLAVIAFDLDAGRPGCAAIIAGRRWAFRSSTSRRAS
jgi:UDP-GlcNAc:undecaprenyl-phosphate GlcNAc-1-phosphate transferase